ncbi:MAG: TIGR00282 family metallophosphoesterase [Acidobacteriota bacterium]
MKILVFGDVVGRIGREGITSVLPKLRKQHGPDLVIANVENIAHGKGISPTAMQEAFRWKADVYTSGDHAWDNVKGLEILTDPSVPIVRPVNYPSRVPGRGWLTLRQGAWSVAVINMQGQVMFKNDPSNPFYALDEVLKEPDVAACQVKLLDFHAEATSEKRALGWYADGRLTALWGTHTHVPTADAQILPQGTGYITDVGMNGAYKSIIGQDITGPLTMFVTQLKHKFSPPTEGAVEINALLLTIDPSQGKTTDITLIREIHTF